MQLERNGELQNRGVSDKIYQLADQGSISLLRRATNSAKNICLSPAGRSPMQMHKMKYELNLHVLTSDKDMTMKSCCHQKITYFITKYLSFKRNCRKLWMSSNIQQKPRCYKIPDFSFTIPPLLLLPGKSTCRSSQLSCGVTVKNERVSYCNVA